MASVSHRHSTRVPTLTASATTRASTTYITRKYLLYSTQRKRIRRTYWSTTARMDLSEIVIQHSGQRWTLPLICDGKCGRLNVVCVASTRFK